MFAINYSGNLEEKKVWEERRMKVTEALQYDLQDFHPALEQFVDDEYITVFGSEISSEGIIKLERKLAKNQEPFGTLTVQYDLEEEKTLSKEVEVTSKEYADEWKSLKEQHQ